MVEKILSQEEIDALLSAMSEGEVDLKPDKSEPVDLKAHDLVAQSAVLRGEFFALEEIYYRFAAATAETLLPYSSSGIEVTFVSTERVRFEDFLKSCANPTHFNLYSMDPLSGMALLAIEPGLVFSLVDCSFGGTGTPLEKPRPFTVMEQRVTNKLVAAMLKGLQTCWEPIYPVNIAVGYTETNPDFVRFVDPKDFVLLSLFSLKGKTFSGNLHLSMSYLMLEPIRDHLSPSYLVRSKTALGQNPQIRTLLADVRVNLTAELGKTVLTVRDLLKLKVNDVIHLDKGPEDTVMILVEGQPKYGGSPGVVKGNRAVQITNLFTQNGGKSNSANE